MTNRINGLVLAGGASTRMGQDKGLINYHGKPQREYLADLLKTHCDEVYISCLRSFKSPVTVIADHFNLQSPLNGILSAFHFDPESTWVTVPVDMPNINAKAIEYLKVNRNRQRLATCFLDSTGNSPEPLFTLWEDKARPALFDYFNSGGDSPRKFLMENDVEFLPAPNPHWFVNINTEEELNAYQKQQLLNK
jgi:molybdopterin-guanine dinucleotide biosynthesis protein A